MAMAMAMAMVMAMAMAMVNGYGDYDGDGGDEDPDHLGGKTQGWKRADHRERESYSGHRQFVWISIFFYVRHVLFLLLSVIIMTIKASFLSLPLVSI